MTQSLRILLAVQRVLDKDPLCVTVNYPNTVSDTMSFDNHITSDDKSIKSRLFEKMKQEYGDNGTYACAMLEIAEHLLERVEQTPVPALVAAHCIRQAVREIFQSGTRPKNSWYDVSRDVTNTKNSFKDAKKPTGKELQDLYDAIEEMAVFHSGDTVHQARLKESIRLRAGLDPLTGKNSMLKVYNDIIAEMSRLAHDVPEKEHDDTSTVRMYYGMAIDILATILLPAERRNEIIRLAELPEPRNTDARRLKECFMSPNDYGWFAKHIRNPVWFRMMDGDMLKPPSDYSPWLLRYIVHYLKEEHVEAFVLLIQENLNDWAESDAGSEELCFVAFRLGERGLPSLLELLQRNHKSVRICSYASRAYSKTDASNSLIPKLADILLKPDSGLGDYDMTNVVPVKLVDGMDLASSEERIKILIFKIRNLLKSGAPFYIHRFQRIANLDRRGPYVTNTLIAHLRDALRNGRRLGNPTLLLIGWLDTLPEELKSRFVAWLYSEAEDVDCSSLAEFVVAGCRSRDLTGDDISLLDRLARRCDVEIIAARLADAIGTAPDADELKNIKHQTDQRREDRRRILWAVAMGNGIRLPGWEEILETLDERGMNRASMRPPEIHTSIGPTSPFEQEDFDSEDPYYMAGKIASWRPTDQGGPNPPSALGICRNLEDDVKRSPDKWVKDPVRMVETLKHPTYVAGFFRGLAHVGDSLDAYADRLVQSIQLAHRHPWSVVPLDSSPLEFDSDWQNADMAGIDLIGSLAEKNARLSDESLSVAWEIVCSVAVGSEPKPKETSEWGGERAVSSKDPMLDAINNSRTNAIQTMLYLIYYAKNDNRDVPKEALNVLTDALRLTGMDGAEHRAILASHTKLLHSCLPGWFEQNEPLLFGSKAPENLAQLSLDMHLRWETPDGGILEGYKDGVLDAVRRDIKYAMDCLLLGMFWEIDGYDPQSLATNLGKLGPKYVSLAGECAARLLNNDMNTDRIQRGVDLWTNVLDLSLDPEAFAGYGWWADVGSLDQGPWESLTLRTCRQAGVKLDWAWNVAKRIGAANVITEAGLKILKSLIQSELQPLDLDLVVKHAWTALDKSEGDEKIRNSRNSLRDALLDKGHYKPEFD